jgi:hypothetical protein
VTLDSFVDRMADRERTVAVFAHDPVPDLERALGDRNVRVERHHIENPTTEAFVVVSTDDAVLGSVDLDALQMVVSPGDGTAPDRASESGFRRFLELLADTVFASYDRAQMLATSREVEDRAVRVGSGRLYAGFQRFSAFRPQRPRYESMAADTAVDVTVFGAPDWQPAADSDVSFVPTDATEMREHWLVAFDGAGDDLLKCALLARERDEGFRGFWTYDPAVVDDLFAYLDDTYLSQTATTGD